MSPIKLYKYYSFDKRGYWMLPLASRRLYFSTVNELRTVNDHEEFRHYWYTISYGFLIYGRFLKESYEKFFNRFRILCLGQRLSPLCWTRFCNSGGICYEFDFYREKCAPDISAEKVNYVDSKGSNFPHFYIIHAGEFNPDVGRILSKFEPLSVSEMKVLIDWLVSRPSIQIGVKHAYNEMAFKKAISYQEEAEFRFIHPVENIGNLNLQTLLNADGTLEYEKLGLSLAKVWVSDLNIINDSFPNLNVEVKIPPFLS